MTRCAYCRQGLGEFFVVASGASVHPHCADSYRETREPTVADTHGGYSPNLGLISARMISDERIKSVLSVRIP